ncbi:MAG: hypothetical protein KF866_03195 [Phycisphaeraceae bacterium]|nr:hypothetical protein [Phycisphaeraceae bacterium]MCW5753297.1 hypothetical protein [Phycisphaeraceae bacterium]
MNRMTRPGTAAVGATVLISLAGLCVSASGQQQEQDGTRPADPRRITPGSMIRTTPGATRQGVLDAPGPASPQVEQPTGAGAQARRDIPGASGDVITFSAFSEGVQLVDLVEFVASTLKLQVAIDPNLSGSVTFNSGFSVHRDELLPLLNSLLEQQGFMISQDRFGWYTVRRSDSVPVNPGEAGVLATTRLIRTPNLKPSSLRDAIESQLGSRVGAAAPGQPAAASSLRLSYLDDLGVIVMTDTPQRVAAVASLVDAIVEEQGTLRWERVDLKYIAAPVARDRAIELVGGAVGAARPAQQRQLRPGEQPQQQATAASSGVENFADRLRVDPLGNALIFRGRTDEIALVRQALELLDQPGRLTATRYFAGSNVRNIANLANQQGLGEITTFVTDQQFTVTGFGQGGQQIQAQQQQQQPLQGGPVLVVDEYRGYIVYNGTPEQQAHLARLIEQFKPEDEAIVIRNYPLEHSDAQQTADLLGSVLLGRQGVATGGLLPGGQTQQQQQGGAAARQAQLQRALQNQTRRPGGLAPEDEAGFSGDPTLVEITADIPNNQLIVKAPMRQQQEIARVLSRIDVRRPQVYLDVKIVSISDSDDFRLAFETQLINAGGSGGLLQQNWGLTTPGIGGDILARRAVNAGLAGLTGAVILSDYVPLVINALQEVTNAKLISNPTVLVDDNVLAEIVSLRQEPTTTTNNIGSGQTTTTFAGYEEAGTTLSVTPRVSSGGYLRLSYEITLSNFVGTTSSGGIPPPREDRTIRAESVTIPGDTTIVVGGIRIDDARKTVAKLPILGDIPLLGHAFRDTTTATNGSVLYIFITPRILSDRHFGGHRALTIGPMHEANIASDAPPLLPALMPILDSGRTAQRIVPEPVYFDFFTEESGD